MFFGFGTQKIKPQTIAWLTQPLETPDLIVLKGIIANDPRSDDRCAICYVRYGTPNEDGTITEYASCFPCGHNVGDVCLQTWPEEALEEALLRSGCFFCRQSVVPARYVLEQVKEIWAIVKEMSSGDIHNELINTRIRGPLSRAIEPLRRYVDVEAPSLKYLGKYQEGLPTSFEWLLIATRDFLFTVRKYAEISTWTNSQKINLAALERREWEVELSYHSFQTEVKALKSIPKEYRMP